MELVVISSPAPVAEEVSLINNLFEAGMLCFHLRKPAMSMQEMEVFVAGINDKFLSLIAWHQYHDLAPNYHSKRLHFPSAYRNGTPVDRLENLRETGFVLSTSIHSSEEIRDLSVFDYAFIGPVFDSISKPGYSKSIPENFNRAAYTTPAKIFALGGVSERQIPAVMKMNFDGAGLLGSIWSDPTCVVDNYLKIRKALTAIETTH